MLLFPYKLRIAQETGSAEQSPEVDGIWEGLVFCAQFIQPLLGFHHAGS
jgi:hypothetical protein